MPRLTTETRAHRRDLLELANLAERDLSILFRQFDTADAARQGLMDVLPTLTSVYGEAAVALGADWYEEMRDRAEVRGRFTPVLADLPDQGRTDSLARWGITPLFGPEPDFATALVKVAGGLQRIIANADRQTIQASSVSDRAARGWARAGVGECEFCQMLIGRGAVYTEASADFDAHDRCGCIAVPEFA